MKHQHTEAFLKAVMTTFKEVFQRHNPHVNPTVHYSSTLLKHWKNPCIKLVIGMDAEFTTSDRKQTIECGAYFIEFRKKGVVIRKADKWTNEKIMAGCIRFLKTAIHQTQKKELERRKLEEFYEEHVQLLS
jgi:hypothetical protein